MALAYHDEDNDGYMYYPGLSTAGIFYEEDDGNQGVFQWPHFMIRPPLLPSVDPSPIVCSSSHGLAVFRNSYVPVSIYYVTNPFNQLPHPYNLLIPPPRHHNPAHTEVVLVTDFARPAFHVVCAVRTAWGIYTFDIYSSDTGMWHSIPDVELACDILANSGVSSHMTAYWLTNRWTADKVLRLEFFGGVRTLSLLHLPYNINGVGNLQLGRVGDTVGLSIINPVMQGVDMYTWSVEDEAFNKIGFLGVEIRPGQNFDLNVEARFYGTEAGLTVRCNSMPELIRFESSKMEVPLLVDHRLIVWEHNANINNRARMRVFVGDLPNSIAQGVPHVRTTLLPLDFILNGNGMLAL